MNKEAIICQSCGMPMDAENLFGTEKDGSKSEDYCCYCYKDGDFTDGVTDVNEYIEKSVEYAEQAGMTPEEMKKHQAELLPKLKRWAK